MDNSQDLEQAPSTPIIDPNDADKNDETNETVVSEDKKEKNNNTLATVTTVLNIILSIPFYFILISLLVLFIKDGKIDTDGCGIGYEHGNACYAVFSYAFLMAICIYNGLPVLVLNIICENRLRKNNVENPKKYALARKTFYIFLAGVALLFIVFLLVR